MATSALLQSPSQRRARSSSRSSQAGDLLDAILRRFSAEDLKQIAEQNRSLLLTATYFHHAVRAKEKSSNASSRIAAALVKFAQ